MKSRQRFILIVACVTTEDRSVSSYDDAENCSQYRRFIYNSLLLYKRPRYTYLQTHEMSDEDITVDFWPFSTNYVTQKYM